MDDRVLRQVVLDHESGVANREQELWTLLIFEFWHRLFLERSLEPSSSRQQNQEVAL
jgi:hypothetical protein